ARAEAFVIPPTPAPRHSDDRGRPRSSRSAARPRTVRYGGSSGIAWGRTSRSSAGCTDRTSDSPRWPPSWPARPPGPPCGSPWGVARSPEVVGRACRACGPPRRLRRERRRRDLLPGVDERDRRGGADDVPVLGLDVDARPRFGELDGNPDVADVPLESGRPHGVGHPADLLAVPDDRPEPGELRLEGIATELEPDEFAANALASDALQGLLADVVLRLFLHESLEAHDLEWVVLERHIRVVVHDARLDPPGFHRGGRANVELLARGHHGVPQVVTSGGVEQVDLESLHGGPPGATHEHRDVPNAEPVAPVVREVVDRRPHELLEGSRRLRALHL